MFEKIEQFVSIKRTRENPWKRINETKISNLTTELNNYKTKVQSLETTVTSLNVTINQLNNRVT